jgi:hypothetical protein
MIRAKSDGKRPLGIPRYKWQNNIKMDLTNKSRMAWIGFVWLSTS